MCHQTGVAPRTVGSSSPTVIPCIDVYGPVVVSCLPTSTSAVEPFPVLYQMWLGYGSRGPASLPGTGGLPSSDHHSRRYPVSVFRGKRFREEGPSLQRLTVGGVGTFRVPETAPPRPRRWTTGGLHRTTGEGRGRGSARRPSSCAHIVGTRDVPGTGSDLTVTLTGGEPVWRGGNSGSSFSIRQRSRPHALLGSRGSSVYIIRVTRPRSSGSTVRWMTGSAHPHRRPSQWCTGCRRRRDVSTPLCRLPLFPERRTRTSPSQNSPVTLGSR